MADIELVIKIPEKTVNEIKDNAMFAKEIASSIKWDITSAIVNGTPLPKGHGRLITEPTKEEIGKTVGGQNDFAECIRDSIKAVFDNAPTIIEADKESEDKE